MPIINLGLVDPDTGERYEPTRGVFINTTYITHWRGHGVYSVISLVDGTQLHVSYPPDELPELVDPDGHCAEGGPYDCGYFAYLARRRPTDHGDMQHEGFHVAQAAAQDHAAHCEKSNCSTCAYHERQLRA